VDACESLFLKAVETKPTPRALTTGRQQAPDFTLKDATGSNIRLSDYKGKVVLLNFWATWCGPCKAEIPWFTEFERTHREQGFAVIGVSMDEDGWNAVKPFIDANKINYRISIGDEAVIKEYGGVESLPETLLIDREGKIAARHVGLVSKSEYAKEILQVLGKN
jgi:peroxiredoxin